MARCNIGDVLFHWRVLDNTTKNKKYLCECIHCGIEKMVSGSQLFEKREDRVKGDTKCQNCIKLKTGERYTTQKGFSFTVQEYIKSTNILIRFDPDDLCPDGYIKRTSKYYILHGIIDYPFERSASGVGYMGCEKYELEHNTHIQNVWLKMIQRCYNPSVKDKKGYNDCTVCEEWHCYKNFYLWYKEQMKNEYYEEGYQLDKDLLKLNNKIYCPEYCRLVPEKLNSFLNNWGDTRGTGLPNGVNWKKANKKYQVSIKDENSKRKYLCLTSDIKYGHNVYKLEKERVARVLAEMFEGKACPEIIEVFKNFRCPDYDFDKGCYIYD